LKSIVINIADYRLRLFPVPGYSLELEEGWHSFIDQNHKDTEDVVIHTRVGIPKGLMGYSKPIFEAHNEQQKFYSVYRHGEYLKFIIYSQENQKEIQQVAICGVNFKRWEIYCQPTDDKRVIPLQYPMGPLLMYYLTVNSEAIMIHASGVNDQEKGRIFTGFSGAGKSTISGLWHNAGSSIINDDRLIIRRQAYGFYIHNTPMYYEDSPKRVQLHSAYLISHSPSNTINKIDGALAVTRILAHCIQNNYDKKYIANHLNLLTNLCEHIKVYELGFVPDGSVVDFVREND
jgi:hypothetical protein